jgi:hypothetical protein
MDSKFIKLFLICLYCFISVNCTLRQSKSNYQPQDLRISELIFLQSDDVFLLGVVCDSLKRQGIRTLCTREKKGSGNAKNSNTTFTPCRVDDCIQISLTSKINSSSSDFFRSVGYSLLSLSFGTLVTTSGEMEFAYSMNEKNAKTIDWKINSQGRIGMWAILPFYAGLIATIGGTSLNTYRKPSNLHQVCKLDIETTIGKSESEICIDYYNFIQDSFSRKEKEFYQEFLEKIQLQRNKANQI